VKHGDGLILKPAQEDYLLGLLPPVDSIVEEMEALAAEGKVPISDQETARLVAILTRALGARRVLELGTAIGYGALWLARATPEVQVTTIDVDPERQATARAYLTKAGVQDRVDFILGPAIEVLSRLTGPFDLVYIDAVKSEYRRYLDLALPLLRVGGMVVIDNLLWSGEVADPPAEGESEESRSLRAFNSYLMMHPQLQALILPLGDGVGIATKTRPLRSELGGPL
jgi:caffeoyl-CoA O-methyltransferase